MKTVAQYSACALAVSALMAGAAGATTASAPAESGKADSIAAGSAPASPEAPDSVPGVSQLDEFVIEVNKPVVTSEGGKVNYNVDEDPSSSTSTVLEMLRKVPGVTVDGEDNIRVNGQSSFKLLVNGREDPNLSANASRILKMMPAAAVSRIEIINEPGAKYDAEGVGGILNLVTERKQRTDGYNANLSLSVNNMAGALSGYTTMRYGKVGLSANIDYASTLFDFLKVDAHQQTDYPGADGAAGLSTRTDTRIRDIRFYNLGAGLNLSYEADRSNLFLFSINYNGMTNRMDCNGSTMTGADGAFAPSLFRDYRYRRPTQGLTTSVSYQHNFSEQSFLVANYQFAYNRSDSEMCSAERRNEEGPAETDNQTRIGKFVREHTAQLDYALPWSDGKHLFEAGAKGIFRHNTSQSSFLTGAAGSVIQPVAAEGSSLLQKQEVEAVYASYTGHYGQLTAKAGLRYEHTHTDLDDRTPSDLDAESHLDDIVPSASLTWQPNPVSSLRANYSMRITRPSISQLSPSRGVNLGGVWQGGGNPDLKTEQSHNVGLTYSNYGMKAGFSLTLGYMHTRRQIVQELALVEGDIMFRPMNAGHQDMPSLGGNMYWNMTKDLMLSVNGQVQYKHIVGAGTSNSGWEGNFSAFANYKMPRSFTLSAFGGESSRTIDLYGWRTGWYYYGLSLTKGLLKDDALKISLQAANFLHGTMNYKSDWTDAAARVISDQNTRQWNVGVSVSWTFGSRRDLNQVKAVRTITNDDANGKPEMNTGGTGSPGGTR